ncbi:hypothetical protein AB4043_25855, partial [Terriglobus sp. YAF25]|uniref:hypothetical protein n=1 Tax=Terriglobus sp. YAF25 TaxID=3233080 RepID=UPI003F97FFF3
AKGWGNAPCATALFILGREADFSVPVGHYEMTNKKRFELCSNTHVPKGTWGTRYGFPANIVVHHVC